MKLILRRIGNSLGVIIPKDRLDAWGVSEGDALELGEHGIRPVAPRGHAALDELKLEMALEVVRRFSARQIRAKILANLHRWKSRGSWVGAYDEWRALASSGDDGALFAAMLGRDETAERLRQSMPFVGLLPREEVRRLNEQAAA
jgi:antitoxin component of MazEF toxin-antitoxin module